MTIQELITKARDKSPEFNRQMTYWLELKKKSPELPWLMKRLETVLGKSYVRKAAEAEIQRAKAAATAEK